MPVGSRLVQHQQGFALLMLVTVLLLVGLAMAAIGPEWADTDRREREQELLRVGALYAAAIDSYHRAAPGSDVRYPPSLESLLLDTRYVSVRRHLRALYADPLSPGRPWGVVRAPDGGVRGVYSQDERTPLLRVTHVVPGLTLRPAERYSQWVFSPASPP